MSVKIRKNYGFAFDWGWERIAMLIRDSDITSF